MRLSILIGAGASYGCGYTDPSTRPPLGKDLFSELVVACPETWGTVPDDHLLPLFENDFEDGMTELWRLMPARFSHLLIDLATYFSKFDPPPNDLYSALVRELHASRLLRRTAVASLNYECVFEIAVSQLGLRLCMNQDAPVPGNLLMYKPHGSCNFMPEASVWRLTMQLTTKGQSYYEGPICVKQPAEVREMYEAEYALPPCMSLYAEGKTALVGQSFLDKAREAWARWVHRSDFLISIGTSPNLADAHVWDPIVESRAIVWFVGGEDRDVTDLQGAIGNRFRHVAETFEDAMPILRRRLRLLV